MRRCLFLAIAVLSVILSACTTPTIRSEVTAFHEWPADMTEKTFVFSRTKVQEGKLEYRNYEGIVRSELQRLGFAEASDARSAKLKVAFNYSVNERDLRVIEPVYVDPLWYGPPFYGPRWRGYRYYGPFYDPFWYGPPVIEYRDLNYHIFRSQLRLDISRAADGKSLYDVTVNNEGSNESLAAVMPYLIHSAFADFPGKSGMPHRVDLKTKE